MGKTIKRFPVFNKRAKNSIIDPEVVRLIEKISKKYAGVWRDLAKL